MPQFANNPETGEVIIYDDQRGRWRPASRAEIDIQQAGMAGQVEAAVEGATGIQGLIGLAVPEFAERSAALTSSNTGAAVAGGMLTAGLGGASLASRNMATRTQTKIAQGAEQAATGGGLRTSQGFIRQAEDMVPRPLEGATQIVRSGVETFPVTRAITDYLVRVPNQKNMNRLAARAIGVTDEELAATGGKLTDDLVGLGDSRIGAMFDEVGDRITQNLDNDEVTRLALELANENRISNAKLAAIADNTERSGRNLMSLRSELQRQWRRERDDQLKTQLSNRIDEIDKIIADAIGDDGVTNKLYSDARARYRASLALDKGAARSADDNINVPSLNTQLRSIYGANVTKGKISESLPDDVRNFLEGARQARGVNVGVPTSGTAERMAAMSLLGFGTGVSF